MRVLELFAGDGGWSQSFYERGHRVWRVDNNDFYKPEIIGDIRCMYPRDFPQDIDVILASPPCQKFSMMRVRSNWNYGKPRNPFVQEAMDLVRHTVYLIDHLHPKFWIIENPKGMLRKLDLIPYERRYITYCQYGRPFMKPTDLWGGFPPSLQLRPPCNYGDSCHMATPRGTYRYGVQKLGRYAVTGIPPQLSLEVCLAAERSLDGHRLAIR